MGRVQRSPLASAACLDFCLRFDSQECVQRAEIILEDAREHQGQSHAHHFVPPQDHVVYLSA